MLKGQGPTKMDGRLNRRQLSMFDPMFDRLHLQIFKSTSTKLGRFGPKIIFMTGWLSVFYLGLKMN